MRKDNFYYKGDWEALAKRFGFVKENQTPDEDIVYETLKLEIPETDGMFIEMTVEHYPEHQDVVYMELMQDSYLPDYFPLAIQSDLDLKNIITIFSGKEFEL